MAGLFLESRSTICYSSVSTGFSSFPLPPSGAAYILEEPLLFNCHVKIHVTVLGRVMIPLVKPTTYAKQHWTKLIWAKNGRQNLFRVIFHFSSENQHVIWECRMINLGPQRIESNIVPVNCFFLLKGINKYTMLTINWKGENNKPKNSLFTWSSVFSYDFVLVHSGCYKKIQEWMA